jgi:hypothetical protein
MWISAGFNGDSGRMTSTTTAPRDAYLDFEEH